MLTLRWKQMTVESIAAACPPSRAAQARRAGKAAPTDSNLLSLAHHVPTMNDYE